MMKLYTVGQLFYNMRKKMNFTRSELSHGLCSPSFLEKIEEDQAEPDVLLTQILMQRLGNSADKLEYILSNQDYKWLDSYDQFIEFVFRKREDWANWLLPRLRNEHKKNSIQEMIYYRCHALYQYYIKGNKNLAAQELAKALLQTSSSIFTEELPINEWFIQHTSINKISYSKKHRCVLSVLELENLIALVRILNEQKKLSAEKALKTLLWCKNYIDTYITDKEAHTKIVCKCVWLLSKFYILQGDQTTAFELCDSAFEELQDFGISYFMRPLLRQMLKCKSVYALHRKKEKYERYLETLTHIYAMFGKLWYPQDSILYNCYQCEYFLDYEILRGGRITMGFTQEDMISGVFTSARSLSEIENRKTHPSKRSFQKLMENLNLQKTRFNGMVQTNSIEMLEKVQELSRLTTKKKYIEMERELRELKKNIDMTITENQMVIRYFENVIDSAEGNRTSDLILQDIYYFITNRYNIKKDKFYRTPFPIEEKYINQAAICFKKLGKKQDKIELYQKILETYHKSRVKTKYHFRSYSVLLGNLAKELNSADLSKQAICLCLQCGKLNQLPHNYMTYICALKHTIDSAVCRKMIEECITLCELTKNTENLTSLRQYYQEYIETQKKQKLISFN